MTKSNPMHPQRDSRRVFTGVDLVTGHWPEVHDSVRASLLRRGVSPEDAADILQETALRAMSRTENFDGVEGLRRWAFVVARHLTIEQARRRGAACVAELPDTPAVGADVATTVENRMVAEAVVSALLQLSASDQHAITAPFRPVERPASRKEYIRSAVRRHRARQRLMALCEGLLGIGAWVWRRLGQPATQVA